MESTLLCPDSSWCDFFSSIPWTFSYAKVFFFYGISIGIPIGISIGLPVGFPRYFHDVSMRISMGFLKGCYWSSMVSSWDFFCGSYGISMLFLLDPYGISIGISVRFPMGFPWYFYDISLGLLLDFSWDVDWKFLCYWHVTSMKSIESKFKVKFLSKFQSISMIFQLKVLLEINWK